MYLVFVFVPESHLDDVKEAIFTKGAGKVGNYTHCAWQTLGEGQFKPGEHSAPFIGDKNRLETLEEYKIEFVCEDDLIKDIVAALKEAHPYETPSYQVIKLEDL